MPSFSLFPKRSSSFADVRSHSTLSRQHSPSTSVSSNADTFYSLPYTDCTSLGSPTIVETASPLRLYKEYEQVAATPICPNSTPQSQDEKPLPQDPRRFSMTSSFYSTDDPPQVSLQLQSWIDWSDDEDDNETLDSGYNRKIQRRNTFLKRSYTTAGYNTAPLKVTKIEKEIMELLEIDEVDEQAEEEESAGSRKSISFRSFRPKRQSMGNLLGKLKKSLTIDEPPEWKDQIRPTYFNYMI
jgi:hypothetical protein